VINGLLEANVAFRLRAAHWVLRLADKYPPVGLEAVCTPTSRLVTRPIKGILAAGTDVEAIPAHSRTGDAGAAAFPHGPAQLLANVIPLPTASDALGPDPATVSGDLIGGPGLKVGGRGLPGEGQPRQDLAEPGIAAVCQRLAGDLDDLELRLDAGDLIHRQPGRHRAARHSRRLTGGVQQPGLVRLPGRPIASLSSPPTLPVLRFQPPAIAATFVTPVCAPRR